MKLQKHEREAVQAIREVAVRHDCQVELIRRGKHPCKIVLTRSARRGRETPGIPGSPGDPVWAVKVAVNQAERACRKLQGA